MKKYRCVKSSEKRGWFTENYVYGENFVDDNGMDWSKQRGVMGVDEVGKWMHGKEHCGYKFEEVEEMFGKKDLESGDICVERCGAICVYINGRCHDIMNPTHNFGDHANKYNEDLTQYKDFTDYDIVEVYRPFRGAEPLSNVIRGIVEQDKRRLFNSLELIWKREDEEKTQALEELRKAEESLRKAREKVERLG